MWKELGSASGVVTGTGNKALGTGAGINGVSRGE